MHSNLVNIGEASKQSGINAKMIRYYEDIGLLPQAKRGGSGYRRYSEHDIHTLRFVRQLRQLGFSMEKIGELLELWQNKRRKSRTVKAIAQARISEIDESLEQLHQIRDTLVHLMENCHGDDRPECPILEHFETR